MVPGFLEPGSFLIRRDDMEDLVMFFRKFSLLLLPALFTLLFLVAAPSFSDTGDRGVRQEATEEVKPCVVAVLTYDADGRLRSSGSGLFITKDGEVITSYRLFRGSSSAEVVTTDREILRVTGLVAEDPEHDLVRLSTDPEGREVPCSSPVTSRPKIGEGVVILGSPSLHERAVVEGRVSAVQEVPLLGRIVRLSATLPPGFLGGPVVNGSGEVIGIAVSRGLKKRRFTYAVPADMISRLQPAAPGSWAGELSPSRERYVEGARHLWDGRFERALGLFEESVRLDPAGSDAHFLLGYCYQNLGRFYDAIGAYRQAARLNPGNSEAQYLLGVAYSKLLCFQDAADSFEKVLQRDPEDFRAHYKLGYAYSRLGWQDEATVAFKRAIAARCTMVSPDDLSCSENALLGLDEIVDAFRQHNWSEAQAADVHYQRGLTYAVMARMDLALKEHRALKDLDRTQAARLLRLIRTE
jgi:hypothetical protein